LGNNAAVERHARQPAERLCRLAYERYSEGDFDGLLELFDPDVEVYVAPPNFESGTYHGHAEYRSLLERWAGSWKEMRITPQRVETAGEWILAEVLYVGCGRESDVEIDQPSWELSHWQEGRCKRYEVYWDSERGARAFAKCAGASA
jgi:ketosteroid isomerase-like protein